MSDVKIASAKFVDGYFLYKKLFLVFTLFFSMDSYSWISLKIDHENSSKDHAVIHIVEDEHIIKTVRIAGKEVYISRYFTPNNNEIETLHYVFVKQSTGIIICHELRHHNEASKHYDEDGGWNEVCKRRTRVWTLLPEPDFIKYRLKTISFEEFRLGCTLLKGRLCSDKCTPFNSDLYKIFLRVRINNIKSKERYVNFYAVLDYWKVDD